MEPIGTNTSAPQLENFPWQAEIDFMNDDTHSTQIQETLRINSTGVYIMLFVVCDPDLSQVRDTTATTTWEFLEILGNSVCGAHWHNSATRDSAAVTLSNAFWSVIRQAPLLVAPSPTGPSE